ncbi:hydantoinase/carbamoylase family amidase [Nisaea acidiphila]|uniref:Hydantoinase/carbamoylase family amidase n=1 Tax=Nisaea acidiphila TaxID=1862145 RepID=A0A9J7AVV6_9PROT|nr:hydantoinase/carbamoylase family amidase [Nisaea acidiphila]UUX49557.1 hydantoinase/carbamoylase family amidase [Nisaea acidiphila]
MPKINAERLLNDLKTLRSIGAVETGVVRPALSEKDLEARRWLKQRFEEAGLDTTLDGVANVIGRSTKNGPALIVGSHSDTQPRGGWLDGALGVIYGLEVARALAEDPETSDLAVDVVSWQDEESRFYGCLGSRSWIGVADSEVEAKATDRDGVKLTDALAAAGLTDVPRARMEEGRYVGYLEAHIEQGAWLEEAGEQIGVVTSIVGIRGMTLTFEGEQNHAGTTTMARRKDAATALFKAASRIHEEFPKHAKPTTVWTIGRVSIEPGAASIVPGYAELTLQFRDSEDALLDKYEEIVEEIVAAINAEGRVKAAATRNRTPVRPSDMDDGFQQHLAAAAEKTSPGKWRRMPSAAGHDPMVLVDALPCAMLFIPSIDGISHDFAEDSHEEDIVAGCQVLADAAASILKTAQEKS